MVEIKYVKWGLANNFGDTIELNKHLPKYPNLHYRILQHELHHDFKKKTTWKDLKHDIKSFATYDKERLIFFTTHPSAWVQLFPIWYSKERGIIIDDACLIMWAVILLVDIIITILAVKWWF